MAIIVYIKKNRKPKQQTENKCELFGFDSITHKHNYMYLYRRKKKPNKEIAKLLILIDSKANTNPNSTDLFIGIICEHYMKEIGIIYEINMIKMGIRYELDRNIV